MFQRDFNKKINFANPKTMFKSTRNIEQGKTSTAISDGSSDAKEQPPEIQSAELKLPETQPPELKPPKQEQQQLETATAASASASDESRAKPNSKHPLQNTWTLWYLENDRSKSWKDMQHVITSFETVEDFWSLYNHIKPPSDIKLGSDYSMFKKGIRPMWEDAANKQGGRWMISLNMNSKSDLNNLWLDVLLCLIGEAFDNSDQICGAVVNIRGKSNKISIWTADGKCGEAILEIGHKLRDTLRLGRKNFLQYQLHKDSMVKQGSAVKSIYTL